MSVSFWNEKGACAVANIVLYRRVPCAAPVSLQARLGRSARRFLGFCRNRIEGLLTGSRSAAKLAAHSAKVVSAPPQNPMEQDCRHHGARYNWVTKFVLARAAASGISRFSSL